MTTSALLLQRRAAQVAARSAAATRAHPKMVLVGHLGSRVVVPFAPVDLVQGGLPGSTWEQVARGPGRRPLLVPGDVELRTLSGTLDVVLARDVSVEPVLSALRALAARRELVTVSYGPSERGVWRLSLGSITPRARQHGTNAITRADVPVTFTEVSDPPRLALARIPTPPPKRPPSPRPERVHIFRKGETCWELAGRYYGDSRKWPVIAKRNNIKNVRRIPIGFRAVIPNL